MVLISHQLGFFFAPEMTHHIAIPPLFMHILHFAHAKQIVALHPKDMHTQRIRKATIMHA